MQKIIQILLAKFEELQEMRKIKMGLHSMSPRSFAGISQNMKFLKEICRTFLT
jgi:hypothetical protein